jgi:hypothetical protein
MRGPALDKEVIPSAGPGVECQTIEGFKSSATSAYSVLFAGVSLFACAELVLQDTFDIRNYLVDRPVGGIDVHGVGSSD